MVTVDDGTPRERIEIELTEHADTGGGRRRRGRHGDPRPLLGTTPAQPSPGAPAADAVLVTGVTAQERHDLASWGTERRRLVVTGLAAGVIALFIGWALGRSGGPGSTAGDASGDDAPASSAPATTDPDFPVGSAAPSVAPDDLPTTSRPFTPIVEQSPTTTEVPEWIDEQVLIDPRLAASGVELVALTTEGITTVDLVTSTRSTYEISARNARGDPRPVYAGAGWILVYSADRQRAQLFDGRAEPEEFAFGTSSQQMTHERGSDVFVTIQQIGYGENGDPVVWEVREQPYDGSPPVTVTTIELAPSLWAQGPDPAGGLIVYSPGGMYRADSLGTQRLSNGQLLGLSASTVVSTECGETLDDCHVIVQDRATGERRQLVSFEGGATVYEPTYSYFGTLVSNFSPDEQYLSVQSSGPTWMFGLLSLVDGEFIPLAQPYTETNVEWSSDGRFAFYLDNGKISAYDTVERITIEDVAPIAQVTSFTVRPVTV